MQSSGPRAPRADMPLSKVPLYSRELRLVAATAAAAAAVPVSRRRRTGSPPLSPPPPFSSRRRARKRTTYTPPPPPTVVVVVVVVVAVSPGSASSVGYAGQRTGRRVPPVVVVCLRESTDVRAAHKYAFRALIRPVYERPSSLYTSPPCLAAAVLLVF